MYGVSDNDKKVGGAGVGVEDVLIFSGSDQDGQEWK